MRLVVRITLTAVVIACALPFAVAGATPAHPETRAATTGAVYVAVDGDDESCARGDAGHPCASWGRAWQLACGGDTIWLGPGTYGDQQILADNSCGKGPGAAVTFTPAPGATVTLEGVLTLGANNGQPSGNSPSGLTLDGDNRLTIHGGVSYWYQSPTYNSNVTFENFHIWHTEAQYNGRLFGIPGDNALMRNVEIGPICCGSSAIDQGRPPWGGDPTNVRFDHLYVHDILDDCRKMPAQYAANCTAPATGAHVDGLHMWGANGFQLTNSRWFDLAGQVLYLEGVNRGQFRNVLIANNMFATVGPNASIIIKSNSSNTYGPNYPLIAGTLKILFNTIDGGAGLAFNSGSLPSDQWAGPDAQVTIAGNTGFLNMPCNQKTGHWTWDRNMWTNAQCPGDSPSGRPNFVSGGGPNFDLHLQRRSAGIGAGPILSQRSFDTDGHLRPLGMPSDVGASQRETATFGQSGIGAVRLGANEQDVVSFYGSPPHSSTVRIGNRHVRVARYSLHGGTLSVAYSPAGTVIGAWTTSRYYGSRSPISVGVRPPQTSAPTASRSHGSSRPRTPRSTPPPPGPHGRGKSGQKGGKP